MQLLCRLDTLGHCLRPYLTYHIRRALKKSHCVILIYIAAHGKGRLYYGLVQLNDIEGHHDDTRQ